MLIRRIRDLDYALICEICGHTKEDHVDTGCEVPGIGDRNCSCLGFKEQKVMDIDEKHMLYAYDIEAYNRWASDIILSDLPKKFKGTVSVKGNRLVLDIPIFGDDSVLNTLLYEIAEHKRKRRIREMRKNV